MAYSKFYKPRFSFECILNKLNGYNGNDMDNIKKISDKLQGLRDRVWDFGIEGFATADNDDDDVNEVENKLKLIKRCFTSLAAA